MTDDLLGQLVGDDLLDVRRHTVAADTLLAFGAGRGLGAIYGRRDGGVFSGGIDVAGLAAGGITGWVAGLAAGLLTGGRYVSGAGVIVAGARTFWITGGEAQEEEGEQRSRQESSPNH